MKKVDKLLLGWNSVNRTDELLIINDMIERLDKIIQNNPTCYFFLCKEYQTSRLRVHHNSFPEGDFCYYRCLIEDICYHMNIVQPSFSRVWWRTDDLKTRLSVLMHLKKVLEYDFDGMPYREDAYKFLKDNEDKSCR